jgi:uncharacterized protein (DUF952 family)
MDGFVHATRESSSLLSVGTHFYRSSEGQWVCLEIDPARLHAQIRYEPGNLSVTVGFTWRYALFFSFLGNISCFMVQNPQPLPWDRRPHTPQRTPRPRCSRTYTAASTALASAEPIASPGVTTARFWPFRDWGSTCNLSVTTADWSAL